MRFNDLLLIKRKYKILISILVDTVLLYLSLYLAVSLRMEVIWNALIFENSMPFLVLSPLIIALSGRITGIHKSIVGSFDVDEIGKIFFYSIITALFYVLINYLSLSFLPRSVPIIYAVIFILLILVSRLTFKYFIFLSLKNNPIENKEIFIYGAGSAGIRLLKYLRTDPKNVILGFIDDDISLDTLSISGLKVFQRNRFTKKYKTKLIDEIWIAMPSTQKDNIRNAYNFSKNYTNKVLTLPEINQMMLFGKIDNVFKDTQNLNFIKRDEILINKNLFIPTYENKSIMVTGAGGSIGSELVRQLLTINLKRLILLDISEHALYQINNEIENELQTKDFNYKSCLGSINDKTLITKILRENKVNVVIHAAAYKHVPLVEANITEGVKNNIIGTYNLLSCCVKENVNKFVLISSDKAVRPTSIMGKTKRVAEIIVQNMNMANPNFESGTVRFGNVLGSSGSVIPLFQKQILKGGPVTITDKKMTRYFMSLPEACQLVLVAGHFSKDSEIFLLDMGEPIRIYDLAKSMINFYGYKLKDKKEDPNDIEIKFTNIRPGEKLFEELLIDNNAIKTKHSKVLIDSTNIKVIDNVELFINELRLFIEENKEDQILNKIEQLLEKDL